MEDIAYRVIAAQSKPDHATIARFVQVVRGRGVSVSVRKTKGREIDAACGQLRATHQDAQAVELRSRR